MQEISQRTYGLESNTKTQFLDAMSDFELRDILMAYLPIIKLGKHTYMIGTERKQIKEKDGRLVVKTVDGYITLDVHIKLECIECCLAIEKTMHDLLKSFKQVVLIHLQGHKADQSIINAVKESENTNYEVFIAIIKRLRANPE